MTLCVSAVIRINSQERHLGSLLYKDWLRGSYATEGLTWICADEGLGHLPLWNAGVECLEEDPHADGHQGGQHAIEDCVEDADLD